MAPEEDRALPRLPPSGKPVITRHLGAWWLLAAGLAVAMGFVATDHMWRATAMLSLSLLLAGVLRLTLPTQAAGGLVVRRPVLDAVTLISLGVVVAVSGFTLDLTALVK